MIWFLIREGRKIMSQVAGSVTGQKLWSSWRATAGRGRASRPGEDHQDVENRWNPHSLVLR